MDGGDAAIDPHPTANGTDTLQIRGKSVPCTVLLGAILQGARQSAGEALGREVHQAWVAYPSWLGASGRADLETGLRAAGFQQARLVPAATAIALSLHHRGSRGRIGIARVHNGSVDLGIADLQDEAVELNRLAGIAIAPGRDLIGLLARHLIDRFRDETGLDLAARPKAVGAGPGRGPGRAPLPPPGTG